MTRKMAGTRLSWTWGLSAGTAVARYLARHIGAMDLWDSMDVTPKSVTVIGNLLRIHLTDSIPASHSSPLAHDTENRSRVGGKYKRTPSTVFSYRLNVRDSTLAEGYPSPKQIASEGNAYQLGKALRHQDDYFLGGLGGFEGGMGRGLLLEPTTGLVGGPLGEKCDGLKDV